MPEPITDNIKVRWFEPRRVARSGALKAIIERACGKILGNKQRERSESHDKIEALIADLFLATSEGYDAIWVDRDPKSDRYSDGNLYKHPPVEAKSLPDMTDTMRGAGMLEIVPGSKAKKEVSRVRPGPWLRKQFAQPRYKLNNDDVALAPYHETIILKGERPEDRRKKRPLINYTDTRETRDMRERMKRMNDWLESLNIKLDDAHLTPDTPPCDSSDRSMRRIFGNGRFDYHGRLYGGFWPNYPKKERWRIRIDDERVVQLDFNAMFLRLAHARAPQPVAVAADCDPYVWKEASDAGLSRDAVKTLINARFFDNGKRQRYPRKKEEHSPDFGEVSVTEDEPVQFPDAKTLPASGALELIETRHPAIAKQFGTGIGHHLFFDESEIILDALENCKKAGIPALPIYDALLVPASKFEQAGKHMADAFRKRTKRLGIELEPQIRATRPNTLIERGDHALVLLAKKKNADRAARLALQRDCILNAPLHKTAKERDKRRAKLNLLERRIESALNIEAPDDIADVWKWVLIGDKWQDKSQPPKVVWPTHRRKRHQAQTPDPNILPYDPSPSSRVRLRDAARKRIASRLINVHDWVGRIKFNLNTLVSMLEWLVNATEHAPADSGSIDGIMTAAAYIEAREQNDPRLGENRRDSRGRMRTVEASTPREVAHRTINASVERMDQVQLAAIEQELDSTEQRLRMPSKSRLSIHRP